MPHEKKNLRCMYLCERLIERERMGAEIEAGEGERKGKSESERENEFLHSLIHSLNGHSD